MKKWKSPKEYLSQVIFANEIINSDLNIIAEMKSDMTSISSRMSDDVKVQTSNRSDFTDTIVKIIDMEKQVDKKIDRLVNLKIKLINEIEQLDTDINKVILKERYIACKKLIDIAHEYHYSTNYVYKLHGGALEEFRHKFQHYFIK